MRKRVIPVMIVFAALISLPCAAVSASANSIGLTQPDVDWDYYYGLKPGKMESSKATEPQKMELVIDEPYVGKPTEKPAETELATPTPVTPAPEAPTSTPVTPAPTTPAPSTEAPETSGAEVFEPETEETDTDLAPYKNPYMSYEPFAYVKGGIVYSDFSGLTDFGQFARLDGEHIAVYPTTDRSFYYIGEPGAVYTYRSRIIDFIGAEKSILKSYKEHIQKVGFEKKSKFASTMFPEYAELIEWQLKYDYDFKLDSDGVFVIEDIETDTFRWLLIGESIAYDSEGGLTKCIEFRFYSLTRSNWESFSILNEAGKLNSAAIADSQNSKILFTPNAVNDINSSQTHSGVTIATPNAIDDIRAAESQSSGVQMPTPNAVGDINSSQTQSGVNLPTPNAVDDITAGSMTDSIALPTPNAINDINDLKEIIGK